MRDRPSLLDRMTSFVAQQHAGRVFAKFLAATRRATAVQEQVLLAKIRRNANSAFGCDYKFDHIHSAKDFVREVPILRYEDHQPYIERVKKGEKSAMFGERERVLMFALTSGTSNEPKYIPVTTEFLREYRRGWNAFGIKALLDHRHAFLRRIVQVTSRMDESCTSAGIPCGAITGLMAATQKRLVRKYYVAPECVARIDDPMAKYYTIMRLAVASDVSFMITASPATQLKLARTADTHREQLVRDIHDGTLWPELAVSANERQALRLVPDRIAAQRLEMLIKEHGALLPKHYWKLSFLANWTGGTMGLYLREFSDYFGDVPVRDIGLLASEGRISIPIEDGTAAGILDVTSHFFEFVPVDRIDEAAPATFRSHQLEVGQEYYVLLTSSCGLYRYHIGDVVRVTGYVSQAPLIEFLNKGSHVSSLAGEKLTERQVVLAMERAARDLNTSIQNFVLAPQWNNPPYYMLHVDAGVSPLPVRIGTALDQQLQSMNIEYAERRRSRRIGPVQENWLPRSFLANLDKAQAAKWRKSNEQYKHRYLFSQPGEDQHFPSSARHQVAATGMNE